MTKSRAEKTLQARQRRKKDREQKRFNNPLRIYIERNHPKIFKEFTNFYNTIHYIHPRKKDLTKSETFKEWMMKTPTTSNSSETSMLPNALNPSETSMLPNALNPSETSMLPNALNPSESSETSILPNAINPSETSMLPNALNPSETSNQQVLLPHISIPLLSSNEVLAISPSSEPSLSLNEAPTSVSSETTTNRVISDTIDELFEANTIPDDDILPDSINDEGIELLDILNELMLDYEPFNFTTETEGF